MKIELKPEQAAVLERATELGLSPEEMLDRAFTVLREQFDRLDWLVSEREAIAAHLQEGLAQAERNELLTPEEAARILRERRAKRQVA